MMDRDEAQSRKRIDYFEGHTAYTNSMGIGMVGELVDKIYDDFKSRTCENCRWCDKEDKTNRVLHYCGHPDDSMDLLTYLPLGFGCNKFERKTDVNV